MTTPAGTILYTGFKGAIFFPLSIAGYPAAVDETAYEGIDVEGVRTLEIQRTEPRKISHPGKDVVLGVDWLPPLEGDSMVLTHRNTHFSLYAALRQFTNQTLAEALEQAWNTDKDGFEAIVGFMAWQQGTDLNTGARRWRTFIWPSVKAVPMPAGMNETTVEGRIMMAPNSVARRLWGDAPALGTEGFSKAGYYEYVTANRLRVVSFLGDGATLVFNLPTAYPAVSTDVMAVFENGVEVTAGITKAVGSVTYAAAPDATDEIVVVYQTPD